MGDDDEKEKGQLIEHRVVFLFASGFMADKRIGCEYPACVPRGRSVTVQSGGFVMARQCIVSCTCVSIIR